MPRIITWSQITEAFKNLENMWPAIIIIAVFLIALSTMLLYHFLSPVNEDRDSKY